MVQLPFLVAWKRCTQFGRFNAIVLTDCVQGDDVLTSHLIHLIKLEGVEKLIEASFVWSARLSSLNLVPIKIKIPWEPRIHSNDISPHRLSLSQTGDQHLLGALER